MLVVGVDRSGDHPALRWAARLGEALGPVAPVHILERPPFIALDDHTWRHLEQRAAQRFEHERPSGSAEPRVASASSASLGLGQYCRRHEARALAIAHRHRPRLDPLGWHGATFRELMTDLPCPTFVVPDVGPAVGQASGPVVLGLGPIPDPTSYAFAIALAAALGRAVLPLHGIRAVPGFLGSLLERADTKARRTHADAWAAERMARLGAAAAVVEIRPPRIVEASPGEALLAACAQYDASALVLGTARLIGNRGTTHGLGGMVAALAHVPVAVVPTTHPPT